MKLIIAPKGEKGRSFSAELLAYAEADTLWEGGQTQTDVHRPVWMVLGGSELELRAFMANLLTGKIALVDSNSRTTTKFEILRSAGYAHHTVKVEGGGAITTVYLPELFRRDPNMVDPDIVQFVVIPPRAWVDAQTFDIPAARHLYGLLTAQAWSKSDEDLRVLLAEGVLFLSYLDRRCRFPIPFDPMFGAWLLLVCQANRVLYRSSPEHWDYRLSQTNRYQVEGAERVQALAGFAYSSTHEMLGKILSDSVRKWFTAQKTSQMDALEDWLSALNGVTHG